MKPQTNTNGSASNNRYRMPGIEREGIAQLSLLETALWPLQGGIIRAPRFETSYSFMTDSGQQTAKVTVRSAIGLQPIDEYILWGLLGSTLSTLHPDSMLLATPYWMLKQLGMGIGGSQYAELRDSLLRLSTTSYQNTGFYNPETQAREWVAFQFLSILLPTVGDVGGIVDNNRCWRIEWNPAFFRFCRVTGGNLLFDLDLYRQLTPASRRLFLKLKDRFWRSKRVFLNVDDLTINGLGFSAERPLKKRKYDLTQCIRELLTHGVIELGKEQSDPKDLFLKRGKGSYVVTFYEGEYFRHPLAGRTTSQKNAIASDPLYEPLRKIGIDEAGIRRLFHDCSRNNLQRWVRITDAAMHEKPQGFSGFKVSPAAFLMDGVQHNRMPPDWMHAHEKQRSQQQWEAEHKAFTQLEQQHRLKYVQERAAALQRFLQSPEGRKHYQPVFQTLMELYKRLEPHRASAAAHEAATARIERDHFEFPEYAVWALTQQEQSTEPAS
jgi:hypothetical protein